MASVAIIAEAAECGGPPAVVAVAVLAGPEPGPVVAPHVNAAVLGGADKDARPMQLQQAVDVVVVGQNHQEGASCWRRSF